MVAEDGASLEPSPLLRERGAKTSVQAAGMRGLWVIQARTETSLCFGLILSG